MIAADDVEEDAFLQRRRPASLEYESERMMRGTKRSTPNDYESHLRRQKRVRLQYKDGIDMLDINDQFDNHYDDDYSNDMDVENNEIQMIYDDFEDDRLDRESQPQSPRTQKTSVNSLSSGSLEDQLTNILKNSFASASRSLLSDENSSKFVNRMTSTKYLPSYYGDPLEWYKFKEAVETSTSIGEYSDKENLLRLSDALKGDAKALGHFLQLVVVLKI